LLLHLILLIRYVTPLVFYLYLLSQVACLGGNGAGKSTLVRLLVGDLLPLTGDVWKHPSLRIACAHRRTD